MKKYKADKSVFINGSIFSKIIKYVKLKHIFILFFYKYLRKYLNI